MPANRNDSVFHFPFGESIIRSALSSVARLGSVLLLIVATSSQSRAQVAQGQIVFAHEHDAEQSIYVVNGDGSNLTRLTSGKVHAPVWSPDGCKIVFRRDVTDIYIMDADGSNQTLLVRGAHGGMEMDLRSFFSPDGTRIAFVSESNDIMVMNADGSDVTRLTEGLYAVEPSWSADGSKILFGSSGMPPHIQLMNLDGTDVEQLARGISPNWSRDGSKIAFALSGPDGSNIWVINADGSSVTNLTERPGYALQPSWSPDGWKIAFSGLEDEDFVLYVMNADGTGRVRVADHLLFVMTGIMIPPTWSPDGSRIAFIRSEVSMMELGSDPGFSIYSVNSDASGLTRLTTLAGVSVLPMWGPTCDN